MVGYMALIRPWVLMGQEIFTRTKGDPSAGGVPRGRGGEGSFDDASRDPDDHRG